MKNVSVDSLKEAITIKQQIEALEKRLVSILGGATSAPAAAPAAVAKGRGRRKRNLSPEGRARIAAAAKKRWAKVRAGKKD